MLSILKKIFNKVEPYEYRAIVSETLPLYHDRFRTTNKNVVILKEDDDRITKLRLESQNKVPIKFHKDFEDKCSKNKISHTGDENFELNGFRQGQILKVEGTGFLENESDIYEVVLVTDEYVYKRNLQYNTIYPSSYKELERMKNMGALKIK